MSEKMKFKSYYAFKVSQVYLITELKDNCVYKTKFLGYTLTKDICIKSGISGIPDIENISLSSLGTNFSLKDEFEVEILSLDEIQNIVNNSKMKYS